MVRVRSRAAAVSALALVAVAAVGTAALAQSPSAGESPAAGSMAPITPISGSVVVIPKQVNNPYFDVAFKGGTYNNSSGNTRFDNVIISGTFTGSVAPAIAADTNATVDAPFTNTFVDNADWRSAITAG